MGGNRLKSLSSCYRTGTRCFQLFLMASAPNVANQNRTALITGAGQGIGEGIALQLARDGYNVAINDIHSNSERLSSVLKEVAEIAESKGNSSSMHLADVSSEEDVRKMVENVVKVHGGLDVMIANAGIMIIKPMLQTTTEEADKIMSVNFKGVFLCYKYAAIQMIAQGRGGRIIGASSIGGKQGGSLTSIYCASKFAVRGLTQASARELGPHKITVNAYAPGCIETFMTKAMDTQIRQGGGRSLFEQIAETSSLGYNATPAEIASLVSYLASKEAHFITGQTVLVDGGVHFD